MNESALTILMIPIIAAGMTARSLTAVVKRNQQPRQIGTPSTPTIFLNHIATTPYGWPARQDVWNTNTSVMDHTTVQFQRSKYQISGLAPQSPGTPANPTTGDYVRAASLALQDDFARAALFAQNVGILRISDVTSSYFEDEKNQNEEIPTFDVILSHMDVLTINGIIITDFELTVDRV
jgi:hypothetical protein